MQTETDVRALEERVAELGEEVVSLYLDVNPANPDNQRKAWALRARAAMDELDLPDGVSRRISERLKAEVSPDSRTLAVFASATDEEEFHVLEVEHDLRSVTGNDGAIARYGSPFLVPLRLNALRRRPTLALQLSGDRIRIFLVTRGGIRELEEVEQTWDETYWRTDESRGSFKPGETQRGGSPKDAYDERTGDWIARLYKDVGAELPQLAERFGAVRVLLSGTSEDVAAFESELEGKAADLVKGRLPLAPNPDASPGELHGSFVDEVRNAEDAESLETLESAVEQGVRGTEQTLAALNEGRVHALMVPDVPYEPIWRCRGSGRLFSSKGAAAQECSGDDLEELPLADALPSVVETYGTELRFLSGEADERLRNDLGGLAGLVRW